MRRHALIAGLTSALVASLIAVAPSSANDLRPPDTRDAADAVVLEHAAQSDLRSPDTRDAADAAVLQHAARSDLRSPRIREIPNLRSGLGISSMRPGAARPSFARIQALRRRERCGRNCCY